MRMSLLSKGNEVVVTGNARFISKIVHTVQQYEQDTIEEEIVVEETVNKQQGTGQGNERTKRQYRKRTKNGILKHRAPRWSAEEDTLLKEFLVDKKNYGSKGIKGTKMKSFAKELRRTQKSISLRISGTKELRALRDGVKAGLWSKLNKW